MLHPFNADGRIDLDKSLEQLCMHFLDETGEGVHSSIASGSNAALHCLLDARKRRNASSKSIMRHEKFQGGQESIVQGLSSDEKLASPEIICDPCYVTENDGEYETTLLHNVSGPRRNHGCTDGHTDAKSAAINSKIIHAEKKKNTKKNKLSKRQTIYLAKAKEKESENKRKGVRFDDEKFPPSDSCIDFRNSLLVDENLDGDLTVHISYPSEGSVTGQCRMQTTSQNLRKEIDAKTKCALHDSTNSTEICNNQFLEVQMNDATPIRILVHEDNLERHTRDLARLDETCPDTHDGNTKKPTRCRKRKQHLKKNESTASKSVLRVCWIDKPDIVLKENGNKFQEIG